jgi:hypothetical protein
MYPMISDSIKKLALQDRKEGFSIREIAVKYKIAQSTISILLRNVILDKRAKIILSEKASQGRKKATQSLMRKREERQEVSLLVAEEILGGIFIDKSIAFLIASLSYECEGGKSNFGVVEFTNSDTVLVKLFLSALRQSFTLDESKFRVVMHLHSYHNEKDEKIFWSSVTSIPMEKFTKTFQKQESGINKKAGYRGCVQIKYFDVSIKRTLLASKAILAKKMGL